MTAPDLTQLSESQLREHGRAVSSEVKRREGLDEAERAGQFRAELQEVRDGSRPLADEYLPFLTPREVTDAINRGQAGGYGVAPDKRLSRR